MTPKAPQNTLYLRRKGYTQRNNAAEPIKTPKKRKLLQQRLHLLINYISLINAVNTCW